MTTRTRHPSATNRPVIIGILNVTPDSFSDGGRYATVDDAVAHAEDLVENGANIIDVGGESTRPGAARIDSLEEKRRVMPVITELVARGIPVSIDTMSAATAEAAVEAGVTIINDVSGGLADKGMRRVAAESALDFIAMHWRGPSAHMDQLAQYTDVVRTVREELKHRIAELIVAGVKPRRIIIDPGLGFAKNAQHNWQLLGRLDELTGLGHRVLIGASRKRFLAPLLPDHADTSERDQPTAVISALAAESGVWGVRVHDAASTVAALDVWSSWSHGRDRTPRELEAAR